MLCRNPYISGGGAYGCGQCLPCRINKKREWTHRLLLEATQHPVSSFWTLTYSDENIPFTADNLPTLSKEDCTNFLKRLRRDYHPDKLRYFYVGEYGDTTERPHYHFALFNYPACARGVTRLNRRGSCCDICDRVSEIWGKGHVYSGLLEDASAAYISGYVTKKLTRKEDIRLCGRHPEFAQMSLKPGIGAGFIPEVASVLLSHNLDTQIDVPTSLQHGTRVRPLGRYLTRQLRMQIGKAPNAPLETLEVQKAKLQDVRQVAQKVAPKGLFSETFRALIIEANDGQASRVEHKAKLYRKRGNI